MRAPCSFVVLSNHAYLPIGGTFWNCRFMASTPRCPVKVRHVIQRAVKACGQERWQGIPMLPSFSTSTIGSDLVAVVAFEPSKNP